MIRYSISTLILALAPLALLANGNITGKVVSKETGEPVDFATVQLIDGKTNKPLPLGTTTDEQGFFVLENIPDGQYSVKVMNLGSVDQERPAVVKGADVEIGTIRLADDSKMLQEVVVEGVRSQMRFELDRKIFNVDASIAASGASASELLEAIPSVEVDQDGEVSLRGNSSVTVWINGKESGLSADNRAQILEQIPAETIERVEVITNPSAKYSPEGTAGIINIVLKKDRRAGYFGAAEIGGDSRGGGNANVSINLNSGKWDAYASVGFRMRHSSGGSRSERTYSGDQEGDFLNSEGKSRNHGNNVFLRLGATYHMSDKDDFYANGFGMFGHMWGHSSTLYTSNLPGQWNVNSNFSQNKRDMRSAFGELGYTHKWTDNHTLDMNLGYHYWGGAKPNWSSYLQQQSYVVPDDWDNIPLDDDGSLEVYDQSVFQRQEDKMSNQGFEAKVDYTNHITRNLKLEAGFDGRYDHEDSPVTTYTGTTSADAVLNPGMYNRFIYNNNVSALYTTLGGKFGDFSFSAGVRSEAWQVRTKSLAYGQDEASVPFYKKNFWSLFPSAFLSYSLPHDNELQINYTRRIRRPWGGQLNSFENISDPTNISYGNPELQPEYSNAFELNYIKSFTYHMISVSAYVRTSNNMMNRLSFIEPGSNVMYTTSANVGSQINSGTEIVVKNSLFRGVLDLTTTVNLYLNHQNAWQKEMWHGNGPHVTVGRDAKNSFAWDGRIMASVKLPWGLSFQCSGNYRSSSLTAQGSRAANWSVDAGLRKNLGNWSFSLNCRDIFDSRKMHSITNGDFFTQEDWRWRSGRTIRLTIKYSFGNMRAKRNKNNMQDEPMDTSGGYSTEGMDM